MISSFKDHFSARAALYASYRPSYPDALAGFLAGIAPGRALALDCGCGTGQLTVLLAAHFAHVVGSDASAAQISNASPAANIVYRVARAENSGLAPGSVDLVTVAQAAHWLDLDTFYDEMRRVLRPGGALALISYGITKMDGRCGAVVDRFYRDLGSYWPPERAHVESGYRDLPFPFGEIETPAFDMSAQWNADQLIGYVSTWSAVKALDDAEGPETFDTFAAELASAWGQPQERRDVRWPLALRVGYAS